MHVNYLRWQKDAVKTALQFRRVVVLAGARQCGKTTLVKDLQVSDAIYRTLDDTTLLASALNDPHGFVHHGSELMIIDEIQKALILLPEIKKEVDENPQMGRFLLTGSANIQSLPGVNESLAGRIQKIKLRPLSQGEINKTTPNFLQWAFSKKFPKNNDSCSKDHCIQLALKGGYPEPFFLENPREVSRWHLDYVNALVERDLKDIINIRRQPMLKELLVILSAWSSKLMDISAIASGLSLTRQSITTYISALETLYLVERLPAWSKTDYGRVGKQDKIFMTDTGLMSSILNWTFDKVRLDPDKNGKLIETFVFTQLIAHIEALEHQDMFYTIYHYRDRDKREIDFLIENTNGDLLGIEVKSGSAVSADSFKHLKWFKDNLSKNRNFIGIILYTGEQIASFGDNMLAVPISTLWSIDER